MLFSRPIVNGGYGLQGLTSLGAPDPGVKQLQLALTELSRVTQRPGSNPQSVDGEMTDATMNAIAASFDLLTSELPTWAYLGVQGGLFIGANTALAKKTVAQYAAPLAAAANLAAAKYAKDHPPPVLPDGSGGSYVAEPAWYTTPLGIGGILVGVFAIYKLFFDSPRKAA